MGREPRAFAPGPGQTPTPAEAALRRAFEPRTGGLKSERQVPFPSCTIDVMCFEGKLAVEVDGAQHGWSAEYGARHDRETNDHGFMVPCFTNSDVPSGGGRVKLRILEEVGLPPALAVTLSHAREGRRS